MKLRHWIILAAVGLLALALMPRVRQSLRGHGLGGKLELGRSRVAILPVTGEIADSEWTVRWLRRYADDVRGVKAIVLQLDTPGGGVAPSQEINQAVWRLRDEGIVVVAAMGSEAASGGYYIASACDEIVANPGTITGSIGVIMETVHLEAALKKLGAHFETIKSGEFKDSGNFTRPMLPRERALFQDAIDDVYGQFVDSVAEGRHDAVAAVLAKRTNGDPAKVSDAAVRAYVAKLADGRIYTGRQAQALGLVDTLGGLEDAIDRATDLAGLDDPEVVTFREPRTFAEWMTGMNRAQWKAWLRETVLAAAGPKFSYILR